MIPRQEGGWDKILGNLATARPGTRAWPNQSKDHSIAARLDYGGIFVHTDGERYRNFVLQPNKDGKNPNVAALAKKNTHQKLATVKVSVDHPPSVEEFMNMLGESLQRLLSMFILGLLF